MQKMQKNALLFSSALRHTILSAKITGADPWRITSFFGCFAQKNKCLSTIFTIFAFRQKKH
jgi:hypothetical protein